MFYVTRTLIIDNDISILWIAVVTNSLIHLVSFSDWAGDVMKSWSGHLVLLGNQGEPSHKTRERFTIRFPLLPMSAFTFVMLILHSVLNWLPYDSKLVWVLELQYCIWKLTTYYIPGHNILRPSDVWRNFLITTSETNRNYNY